MLVLTRKTNERIALGTDCVVTVLAIRSDRMQLGIDAPENVIVDREEVYWRREKEARSEAAREGSLNEATSSSPRRGTA